MIGIAIPIKRLQFAKSRLAGDLAPAARQRLVLTLAQHVINAARQATAGFTMPARIWLVSADPAIAALAQAGGVEWLPDRCEELNAALTEARSQFQNAGVQTMIVLAGDLPLVTAADVAALYDALSEADLALAPDQQQRGTNALALRLPSPLPFLFGLDSANRHLAAAARLGLRTRLIMTPTLAFDLDDSERLRQYCAAEHPA
ncbi:2-phospho-L-lactate guanylyltransferase [Chloroflexus islandicus]|uniref:Phosphoenolpyruvate guanylyltransferase n=1 Tax=Chloroflexus islandicus TaxID=1707952 RepID=A0A178M0L4_9CHLR|nr:2-phospho-L-lactate guanylyltransferase [Chloroflexus islandicus]OAN41427.1 2-phospho-L-lactate guanylyltransferase [Chloroflexus islandicus]